MFAVTARNKEHAENYWDFWTYPNQAEALADAMTMGRHYDYVSIVNLELPSPEADFVNKLMEAYPEDAPAWVKV